MNEQMEFFPRDVAASDAPTKKAKLRGELFTLRGERIRLKREIATLTGATDALSEAAEYIGRRYEGDDVGIAVEILERRQRSHAKKLAQYRELLSEVKGEEEKIRSAIFDISFDEE